MDIMLNGCLLYQRACRYWGTSAFDQQARLLFFRDRASGQHALTAPARYSARAHLRAAGRSRPRATSSNWLVPAGGQAFARAFPRPGMGLRHGRRALCRDRPDLAGPTIGCPSSTPALNPRDHDLFSSPPRPRAAMLFDHCARPASTIALATGAARLPLMVPATGTTQTASARRARASRSGWAGFLQGGAHRLHSDRRSRKEAARVRTWKLMCRCLDVSLDARWPWTAKCIAAATTERHSARFVVERRCRIDSIAPSCGTFRSVRCRARSPGDGAALEPPARASRRSSWLLFYAAFRQDAARSRLLKAINPPAFARCASTKAMGSVGVHGLRGAHSARAQGAELFSMLTPINHNGGARRRGACVTGRRTCLLRCRFGAAPHAAGGWTWYRARPAGSTGPASKSFSGLRVQAESLIIEPCIPDPPCREFRQDFPLTPTAPSTRSGS